MRPRMPSRHYRDLTDTQWAILDTLIPEPTPRGDGRGHPWKDRRAVLNGILWVLRTGAPWADVPTVIRPTKLPSPVSTMGSLRSNERDSGSSSPRS
jgi:transposase